VTWRSAQETQPNSALLFPENESSASIIFWERNRYRTFSILASRIQCLSRFWNRNYVRSIQITMAEKFGVEDRGKFYDEAGTVRDVVQNHLLQVLAILAMDPPTGRHATRGAIQKAALLMAVRPIAPGDVVARPVQRLSVSAGRRRSPPRSKTFIALKLFIETWRWPACPSISAQEKCCR